jgi:fructan beta-fructosidase
VPDNTSIRWVDWGRDDYAGVTWSNIPGSDGRRIFIGWMSNWEYATIVPTTIWRNAMTIPREISLIGDKGNYVLISKPASELIKLRNQSDTLNIKTQSFTGEKEISTVGMSLMQLEMSFDFNLSGSVADSLGIILENTVHERFIIGYSTVQKKFYIDRRSAGNSQFSKEFAGISTAPYTAGPSLKFHLFVDASSVELFADDGRLVMTTLVFPTEKFSTLKMFSKGANVLLIRAELHGIERIWP